MQTLLIALLVSGVDLGHCQRLVSVAGQPVYPTIFGVS
jgi:hypothetical protein